MDEKRQWVGVRRTLGWSVVTALCVAALMAVGGIVQGDLDETGERIIFLSLGFAFFMATGRSGISLRMRRPGPLALVGLGTAAMSAVSFVLFALLLWGSTSDAASRWFTCLIPAVLAGSQASIMTTRARPDDNWSVVGVRRASIALATAAAALGIGAVSGAVRHPADSYFRVEGVAFVLALLATTLVPILRKLMRPRHPGAA